MVRQPTVYLPYVLASAVLVTIFALSYPITARVMEAEILKIGLDQQMVRVANLSGLVGGLSGALTGPWVSGLVLSGVLYFILSISGAVTPFKSLFGIVGYARLPLVAERLVAGLINWKLMTTGVMRPADLSAAVLLPDAGPFLGASLAILNPFELWFYALMMIGTAAAARVRRESLDWLGGCLLATNWLIQLGGRLLTSHI